MEGTLAARAIAYLSARQGVPTRLYELRDALKLKRHDGSKMSEAVRGKEAIAAGVTVKKLGHRHTVVWIGAQTAEIPPPTEPKHRKQRKPREVKGRTPKVVVAQNGGTLMGAIAAMLKTAGDKGLTNEDIALQMKKYLPQYKPQSASPAITGLIFVGAAKEERNFGTRRIFFVRDYVYEKDQKKWNEHNQKLKEARHPVQLSATNGSGGMLLIALELGDNKTETVTIERARQLYVALSQLFGD